MPKFIVTLTETHQLEINAPDEEAAADFALEKAQLYGETELSEGEFEVEAVEEVGLDLED